jgi:hypothetical protein
MDLENLDSKTFSEHLHSTFAIHVPGTAAINIELTAVEEMKTGPDVEQFSIIFRGPLERAIKQGTYTLAHGKLGELSLFLVPVGPDAHGMRYQAVFGRTRRASP